MSIDTAWTSTLLESMGCYKVQLSLSVCRRIFSEDKTEQELERLRLSSHSLNPGFHLGVVCCSLPCHFDIAIVFSPAGKTSGTDYPPCWAQGSHSRGITANLLLKLTQRGLSLRENLISFTTSLQVSRQSYIGSDCLMVLLTPRLSA